MSRPSPLQIFIVRSLTRSEIANELNDYVQNSGIPRSALGGSWALLAPDDPKLTDEFCKMYAKTADDAIDEYLDMDEDEAAVYEEALLRNHCEMVAGTRKLNDYNI